MHEPISLEQRVAALEAEIAALRQELAPLLSKQAGSLEQRVAAFEKNVAAIIHRLDEQPPKKQDDDDWIEKRSGSMKDNPEFDEVLRLGAEIRRAGRPPDDEQ